MHDECQETFATLLQSYKRGNARGNPLVFVRSLSLFANEHTQKRTPCAEQLSTMCKMYRDNIGEESISRIVAFEENDRDETRARQAALHLYNDTVKALTKRMTWSTYLMTVPF